MTRYMDISNDLWYIGVFTSIIPNRDKLGFDILIGANPVLFVYPSQFVSKHIEVYL